MTQEITAILIVADDKNDLWPLESPRFPFSCIPFFGGLTLLESAWQRLCRITTADHIWLLCPPDACPLAADLLPEADKEKIIPNELGTLEALFRFSLMLRERYAADIVLISRAAMIAGDEEIFTQNMQNAIRLARVSDCLIVCGVPAREARIGYDYIIAGEARLGANPVEGRDVREFIVNAGAREAAYAMKSGNAWWNSGVYIWSNATFLAEYETHNHEFAAEPEHRESASLEEALFPRAKNLVLFGASIVFSPLRNYEDIARYIRGDAAHNLGAGNIVFHNSKSCLAYNTTERLLVVSGLRDTLLVQTEDAVFVCPRGDEGRVREIMEELTHKRIL
ncbi:MAG: hypothetical protein LBC99_08170 [Spirochaetota bacterium]|jgi:mannose-1-phosphate guanylyltransferase|nr:hypothetical protein [Spirochaetota bacterium]